LAVETLLGTRADTPLESSARYTSMVEQFNMMQ